MVKIRPRLSLFTLNIVWSYVTPADNTGMLASAGVEPQPEEEKESVSDLTCLVARPCYSGIVGGNQQDSS